MWLRSSHIIPRGYCVNYLTDFITPIHGPCCHWWCGNYWMTTTHHNNHTTSHYIINGHEDATAPPHGIQTPTNEHKHPPMKPTTHKWRWPPTNKGRWMNGNAHQSTATNEKEWKQTPMSKDDGPQDDSSWDDKQVMTNPGKWALAPPSSLQRS